MFNGRSTQQLAEEFASGAALQSQRAALWAARGLRRVLPDAGERALGMATALHYPDVCIQVCNIHIVKKFNYKITKRKCNKHKITTVLLISHSVYYCSLGSQSKQLKILTGVVRWSGLYIKLF